MPFTLGTLIRERRQDLGLTQEQFAERIGEGVRQSEVSRLERDMTLLPRRDRLEKLAAGLDLSLGDLLVLTGWMGDQHRGDLDQDVAPSNDPLGNHQVHHEILAGAMEALAAAQGMLRETEDQLLAAERELARVTRLLQVEKNVAV